VTSLLVVACGGSDSSGAGDAGDAGAGDGGAAPTATVGASVGDGGGDDAATSAFVATGEPTGLVAGGSGAGEITPTIDGRTCTVPDLFGTCAAANGSFVVTVVGEPTDSAVWNVVVHCGTAPAVPIASLKQTQAGPATSQLTFAPFGEVIGVQLRTETESSLFVVYQQPGQDCPSVHGAGALDPNSFIGGGQDVAVLTRPDGSLACLSVDASGAFVTSEQQETCSLG
jgi:hypothetical protein